MATNGFAVGSQAEQALHIVAELLCEFSELIIGKVVKHFTRSIQTQRLGRECPCN